MQNIPKQEVLDSRSDPKWSGYFIRRAVVGAVKFRLEFCFQQTEGLTLTSERQPFENFFNGYLENKIVTLCFRSRIDVGTYHCKIIIMIIKIR